jgi:tRNA pseudouridine32 synthase/23S rRNA pseudouridine746 synthase
MICLFLPDKKTVCLTVTGLQSRRHQLPCHPVTTSLNLPGIVYEDEALLLVAKPEGLLSVPGLGDDKQDCLVSRLQSRYPGARIVHRLDRDTSGIMVLARNADVHRELSRQFQDREVDKVYVALITGHPAEDGGDIDLPLRYDPPTKPRQVVDLVNGQSALTHWQVLERVPGYSRVRLMPHTGRTHQLRVHMQALGHPIVGDSLYASAEGLAMSPRLCLHAEQLSFTHPVSGLRMQISLPAPF